MTKSSTRGTAQRQRSVLTGPNELSQALRAMRVSVRARSALSGKSRPRTTKMVVRFADRLLISDTAACLQCDNYVRAAHPNAGGYETDDSLLVAGDHIADN